jgi:hypothetical protein
LIPFIPSEVPISLLEGLSLVAYPFQLIAEVFKALVRVLPSDHQLL